MRTPRIRPYRRGGDGSIIAPLISLTPLPIGPSDTPSDMLPVGAGSNASYSSTEGTITSVVVAYRNQSGAVSSSYDIQPGDTIYFDITVTDSVANERVFTRSQFVPQIAIPVILTSPVISGVPEVGQTVSVGNGVWSPTPTEFERRWLRDDAAIVGQTSPSYLIVALDDEKEITAQVRSRIVDGEAGAWSEWASTTAVSVTYPVPGVLTQPTVVGSAVAGNSLTGTPATFSGGGVTISNEWQLSDDGISWSGTGDTDTTSPEMVEGKYYRFISVGSSSGGTAVGTSSPRGPVGASPTVLSNLSVTQDNTGVHFFYTTEEDTLAKVLIVPTGTIGVLPVTGLAAQIVDETVVGALDYIDVSLTALDDETELGTIISGIEQICDFYVLVDGGGDNSVYEIGTLGLDTDPPEIFSLSPENGASDVATGASLTMVFTDGMTREGTVSIQNDGGPVIEVFDLSTDGEWSTGDETDDTWSVTPSSPLVNSASIIVPWSGLKDNKGNPLPDNPTGSLWGFDIVAAAAAGIDVLFLDSDILPGTLTPSTANTIGTYDTSGHVAGDDLFLTLGYFTSASGGLADLVTVNGITATLVPDALQPQGLSFRPGASIFRIAACPALPAASDVTVTPNAAGIYDCAVGLYSVSNVGAVTGDAGNDGGFTSPTIGNILAVGDGDALIGGALVRNGTTTASWDAPAITDYTIPIPVDGRPRTGGHVQDLAADPAYSFSVTFGGGGFDTFVMVRLQEAV